MVHRQQNSDGLGDSFLELKLHLGCGGWPIKKGNWVNIDYRYQPGVDVVDNIGTLSRYKKDTVDVIYCAHALDHFDRHTYPRVIDKWFELLKPGGIVQIATPDFEVIVDLYKSGISVLDLTGSLYANQEYENNVRHFIWDYDAGKQVLLNHGFENIRKFAPFHDDCSRAERYGSSTSLCIQGTKPA